MRTWKSNGFQSQARCNPLCDPDTQVNPRQRAKSFNLKRDAIPFATCGFQSLTATRVRVSISSEMQSPLRLFDRSLGSHHAPGFNLKRDAIPFATGIAVPTSHKVLLFQSQARCNPLCDPANIRGGTYHYEFQSQARCNPLCDQQRGTTIQSLKAMFQSQARCNPLCDGGCPYSWVPASSFQSQARCNPLCDTPSLYA